MKNINKVVIQQTANKSPSTNLILRSKIVAWPKAFFIAGLISGVNWYYQSFWATHEINHQRTIMDRVEKDQIRNDYKKNFEFHEADQWEGQKVKLDGILLPNRFIVKRNRGDQQGYIVLGPYAIERTKAQSGRKFARTVLINLGWIPKESKHLINQAATVNGIPYNDYSDIAEAKQQMRDNDDGIERQPSDSLYWWPVSTVTAYVRRGEKKDILRGYNNWLGQNLYKFIDLPLFSRVFGTIAHQEASTVYLDRAISEDNEDSIPIPTNKEVILDELNKEIDNINAVKNRRINQGIGASFLSALVLSVI